jgi:hypothetical protein
VLAAQVLFLYRQNIQIRKKVKSLISKLRVE